MKLLDLKINEKKNPENNLNKIDVKNVKKLKYRWNIEKLILKKLMSFNFK